MTKSIKMQISYALRKKVLLGTFIFMIALVLYNFTKNMNYFYGLDASQMYSPLKLSVLSRRASASYYLMQYYPLLVVIPTACLFLNDKNTRIGNYIQTRVSYREYIYGKLITAFTITFLVFVVPLLLELAVYKIVIPASANGDPSNIQYFETIETDNTLFLSSIYYKNAYIYMSLMIVLFGAIAGIFAVFNLALTFIPVFKFKIFVYLPIYVLFYIIQRGTDIFNFSFEANYFNILRCFVTTDNWNIDKYLLFLCIISGITLVITEIRVRRGMIV